MRSTQYTIGLSVLIVSALSLVGRFSYGQVSSNASVAAAGTSALPTAVLPLDSERLLTEGFTPGFYSVDGKPQYLAYTIQGGVIQRQLPSVDAQTFRLLKTTVKHGVFYAADDVRAFIVIKHVVRVIPGAVGATFTSFDNSIAFTRDAKSVYWFGALIEHADSETFTPLTESYAKDKSRAYLGVVPLPVADVASWKPLDDGYCFNPWSGKKRGKGGSVYGWSVDRTSVYWGATRVDGANPTSFLALGNYGKDEQSVYISGKRLPQADAKSFTLVEPAPLGNRLPDSFDKNRKYNNGRPLVLSKTK